MRLTTVQDNNMQQMIYKCCVLLGKKFGSFDRGFRLNGWQQYYARNYEKKCNWL